MRLKHYSFFTKAAILVICGVNLSLAGANDISSKEIPKLRKSGAIIWVVSEKAPVYTSPLDKSASAGSYDWMQTLLVDQSRLANAPSGWIPVKGTPGARLEKPTPDAWIRRRDVVIGDGFKKVTDCWPVKSLTYEIGDYEAEFDFKPDGSARVQEHMDNPDPKAPPYEKAQAYIERNIVKIVPLRKGYGFDRILIAGYRSADRHLYPDGSEAKQELFPESMLKGCASIPIVKEN